LSLNGVGVRDDLQVGISIAGDLPYFFDSDSFQLNPDARKMNEFRWERFAHVVGMPKLSRLFEGDSIISDIQEMREERDLKHKLALIDKKIEALDPRSPSVPPSFLVGGGQARRAMKKYNAELRKEHAKALAERAKLAHALDKLHETMARRAYARRDK